jgi:high-affinity iron transporter
MLLDAVVIVLRETLEAGVLIALLLTVRHGLHLSNRWLWSGLGLGLVGAFVLAKNLGVVTEWFEYTGQEVVNASMQFGIYACLLLIGLLINLPGVRWRRFLEPVLGVCVTLALVREGAEVAVFFFGYMQDEGVFIMALTSGFIGMMIGLSVGVLIYHVVIGLRPLVIRTVQMTLLALVAGGMALQATQSLIQADWLTVSGALWNTGGWLSEQSVVGQVAYAIFGYEASPSATEVVMYLSSVGFFILVAGLGARRQRKTRSASREVLE